jgi:plastocyanin
VGKEKIMIQHKFFWGYFLAAVVLFTSYGAFAQEVQKVTITVAEAGDKKLTLSPKEVTVRPGKVEFTLVNKGTVNHNLAIKINDKPTPLVKRSTAGETVKSEPIELSAGEYEIYCTYTSGGSHKDRGMEGKVIVK